jgi:hypothetical protein
MGPQPPDQFRFLTAVGRRLFVISAVLAGVTVLLLHSLGIDPPLRPFRTGRSSLNSLALALALGIGSLAVGWWLLKRRGINVIENDDEQT